MTKADLVKMVSAKAGIKQSEASKAVAAVFESLKESIGAGESITMVGFGAFKVKERAERNGRNPRTSEAITIPARKTVRFSPGKELKELLNPPKPKVQEPVQPPEAKKPAKKSRKK